MLNYEELYKLATRIKDEFPKSSKDFTDAFDWLSLAIDGVNVEIGKQLLVNFQNQEYDKNIGLMELSKVLGNVQKDLKSFEDIFVTEDDEILEEAEALAEMELENEEGNPDYSKYTVDDRVAHTLYEDFRYAKVCGFEFLGIKYDCDNMQCMLIKLCEILAAMDIKKFENFTTDPTMEGRKRKYFSRESVFEAGMYKNAIIPGTEIYVWTNMSSNQKKNVIMKMLKKYGIEFSELKIFLRADYKELHPVEK